MAIVVELIMGLLLVLFVCIIASIHNWIFIRPFRSLFTFSISRLRLVFEFLAPHKTCIMRFNFRLQILDKCICTLFWACPRTKNSYLLTICWWFHRHNWFWRNLFWNNDLLFFKRNMLCNWHNSKPVYFLIENHERKICSFEITILFRVASKLGWINTIIQILSILTIWVQFF